MGKSSVLIPGVLAQSYIKPHSHENEDVKLRCNFCLHLLNTYVIQ